MPANAGQIECTKCVTNDYNYQLISKIHRMNYVNFGNC